MTRRTCRVNEDLSSQRGPVAKPGEVTVDLGDLVPDESRSVILYLRVSASSEPSLLVLQSRVDFQLPEEAGRPSFQQHQLRLPVGASVRQSAESVDDVVLDTAWLAGVLDLTYLALQSRDWELAEQALQTITAQRVKLDALAARGGTERLREHAALLAHYAEEIEHLAAEGTLHDHERRQHGYEELKKDIHYRRYLLLHHRPGDPEEHQH